MADDPDLRIPLRDYLLALREADREFRDERDRRYRELDEARALATQRAFQELQDWRTNANEWRQAMIDREARFTPLAVHEILVQRLEILEKRGELARGTGEGLSRGWAYVIAGGGLLIALVSTAVAIFAAFGR